MSFPDNQRITLISLVHLIRKGSSRSQGVNLSPFKVGSARLLYLAAKMVGNLKEEI
jgi:hypothetical protein